MAKKNSFSRTFLESTFFRRKCLFLRCCLQLKLIVYRVQQVVILILFSLFAVAITLFIMYRLNPDKDPLPWRAYCSMPYLAPPFENSGSLDLPSIYPNISRGQVLPPFPPPNFDSLSPAGVFVGIFSTDSSFERRQLVRTTWASHPRSRNGAGAGDNGLGTSRTIVRFILGLPRKNWERRVKLEMESMSQKFHHASGRSEY